MSLETAIAAAEQLLKSSLADLEDWVDVGKPAVQALIEAVRLSRNACSLGRVHVGTAVIIVRHDKDGEPLVLMGLRCGKHGPGTWTLPGGWMEHGEEPKQTAIREVEEETGLVLWTGEVKEYRVPYSNTVFPDGVQSLTLFFVAPAPKGYEAKVLEPDKCERWAWFHVDELPVPLFDPLLRASIPEALRYDAAHMAL